MRIPILQSQRRRKSHLERMAEWGHDEGRTAKTIEEQTAKLPSDLFLYLAGGAILASLTLKLMNRNNDALFVGEWAPTLLILGFYNKVVKLLGHD